MAEFPPASGQGSTTNVPPEIQNMGFNWGAAILGSIWCMGNGMSYFDGWFNIGASLGQRGNALAWQKKSWSSIEAFKEAQRRWAVLGFLSLGLLVIMLIGLAVIFSQFAVSNPDQDIVFTFLRPLFFILVISVVINIFFLRRKKK